MGIGNRIFPIFRFLLGFFYNFFLVKKNSKNRKKRENPVSQPRTVVMIGFKERQFGRNGRQTDRQREGYTGIEGQRLTMSGMGEKDAEVSIFFACHQLWSSLLVICNMLPEKEFSKRLTS